MLADNYCSRFFAPKLSEDLGAFTIKSFAKLNVLRNGLRPPIAFNMSILSDVAHEGLPVILIPQVRDKNL